MPKSRGRKPRKHSSVRPQQHRPTRAQREGAQLEIMLPIMQAANEAEVRGDVAGALDVILSRLVGPDGRIFWRPERVCRLSQLYVLGPLLPRWATSRWILAQALQVLEPSNRDRSVRAYETAVRVRGGPDMVRGADEIDRRAEVADHDWVHRQLFLYELGGLDHFLRRVAAPDLLTGADCIHEWAAAPMGAYRLVEETPRELTWEDLGSGGEARTINLGASTLTLPGGCVLGRVVPTEEGLMFESAPLVVPEGAALDVARDRRSWVDAVARACRDEYPVSDDDDLCVTSSFDFALLTDVPGITQHWLQHLAAEVPFTRHDECDPLGLAVGLVRSALEGTLQPLLDDAMKRLETTPLSAGPSVAAALVEPHVSEHLLHELTPADADALRSLGATLPRPASDVCLGLAEMLREAA